MAGPQLPAMPGMGISSLTAHDLPANLRWDTGWRVAAGDGPAGTIFRAIDSLRVPPDVTQALAASGLPDRTAERADRCDQVGGSGSPARSSLRRYHYCQRSGRPNRHPRTIKLQGGAYPGPRTSNSDAVELRSLPIRDPDVLMVETAESIR
jgi:hypothetical protein